jgi:cytochrome c2
MLLAAALLFLAGAGCSSKEEKAARLTGGDPQQGKMAIRQYGCEACHTIPGVEGAQGLVGPPLDRIGSRVYLAGRLSNTPENMMRWIRNPQGIEPGTAMPNLHVTEKDGRDIAAYLYTLQ